MDSIQKVQRKSNVLLLFVIGLEIIFNLFINLYVFKQNWFDGIFDKTKGLIQTTLIVNAALILFMIYFVIFRIGNTDPVEIGITWKKFHIGALVTFSFWLVIQVCSIVLNGLSLHLHPVWLEKGGLELIGSFLAQFFGNALHEELIYRGFILPQVYQRIQESMKRTHPSIQIFIAVLIVGILFALMHIPNRMFQGLSGLELFNDFFYLIGMGAFFSVIYLTTNNIFIAAGIHALVNSPTALFTEPNTARILVLFLTVLFIIFNEFHKTRTSTLNNDRSQD